MRSQLGRAGAIERLAPGPAEPGAAGVDQGTHPIRVIQRVPQGQRRPPRVPEQCDPGLPADNHIQVGDVAGHRVRPPALGPAAAALIPADHRPALRQPGGERAGHVPQSGPAVAHDQGFATTGFRSPQAAVVIGAHVHDDEISKPPAGFY